ncbi:helix-turn-helix domain-containing protein [Halomarina litorea]|uniref:helix-turn-helix domain-containing protein n=1 Tax=Halomarina litorea TaxID=2961595 RepID=UPI0020C2CFFA|nr:helix-turn-helix domain-containing protein [Halomarina sp. BCD28]
MIIIEFSIDHPLLRETLNEAPGVTLSWEQTDALGDGRIVTLLWAEGGDIEILEAGMASDPTVNRWSETAEVGGRRLYQVEMVGDALDGTYLLLVELGCLLQSLAGTAEGWEARVAFPEQTTVDHFFDHCRTTGLGYTIHRVYEERPGRDGEQFGLTTEQLETLRAAVELGYLDVPRENTLQDLGRELDVSDTAASQRFRRGVKRLVENTLNPDTKARPPPVGRPR